MIAKVRHPARREDQIRHKSLTFQDDVTLNFGTGDDWSVSSDGDDLTFNDEGTAAEFIVAESGTSKFSVDHDTDRVNIRDAYKLRIHSADDTAYVDFYSDDTDFFIEDGGDGHSFLKFLSIGMWLQASTPQIHFYESDQGTDEKMWEVLSTASVFKVRTRTDADSVGEDMITATRTGEAINEVRMPQPFDIWSTLYFTTGNITASLTASVDDWAPTGIDDATVILVDEDGNYNITGIDASQTNGRTILLINNDAANTVTLTHNDGASVAANRFLCPNEVDYVLNERASCWIFYSTDSTADRWHVVGALI